MGEPAMGDAAAGGASALTTLSDADAAPILDALKKAAKARNGAEVLPVLESLAGKTHKDFEPALAKLLGHLSTDVASRSATAIGERPGEKTASTLWKGWALPINDKRPAVRGAILRALGKIGARLDAKQYSEAERLWNTTEGADAAALRSGFADYFAAIKDDKRPCKLLALWLDRPQPTGDPNDGNNPPKEWWEARYKLWQATQSRAEAALLAITGQRFTSTDDAKKWFIANPSFGVKW
jgi:hypothetical protein